MSVNIQQFIKFANYYNQTAKMMSAICVQKGGVDIESYVGRFYMADVLEYLVGYSERIKENNVDVPPEVERVMKQLHTRYEKVKHLVTPTEKPIYEMTLEEFERLMNI